MRISVVTLSFVIFMGRFACSSAKIDTIKLRDAPPGAGQKTMELYTSKDRVGRPYEELAVITVDDNGYGLSDEALAEKLKEKAKAIHADACHHRDAGTSILRQHFHRKRRDRRFKRDRQ